jgi:hypothetical protein
MPVNSGKYQSDMKRFVIFARDLGGEEVENAVKGYKINLTIISFIFLISLVVIFLLGKIFSGLYIQQ